MKSVGFYNFFTIHKNWVKKLIIKNKQTNKQTNNNLIFNNSMDLIMCAMFLVIYVF